MRKTIARLLVLPLLAAAVLLAGPGVAGACACGAILADQRLSASDETAFVQLTGRTEQITLNVATQTVATRAAFLMPVPARARFELADAAVFTELDAISRPRVEYRDKAVDGDGAGAPAAGPGSRVTVTDHTKVGPYEVAQLTGKDSAAVTKWLVAHNFQLPADLAHALTPYLADGWHVVAVQLTPDTAGQTFAAGLPSMRLTFDTTEPVYPMRLSATADHPLPLRLYVLAGHRMDFTGPVTGDRVTEPTYANPLRPNDLADYPVLARQVSGPRFLTRYDTTYQPSEITDDIHLRPAANDEPHQSVVVAYRYVSGTTAPPGVWIVAIAAALVLAAAIVWMVRWRRRRTARA
jgi:hypothetical protein